jgi:large subunit ribosomal protein L12e
VRVVGKEGAGASLAQKVGPLGVPAKKVNEDIQRETTAYAGLRLRCKVIVKNRVARIEPMPSTACLVIQALKEPPRDRKKEKNIKHHGNLTFNTIVEIARKIRSRSLAKNLAGTVKEVLGTCRSMGCSIDGMAPAEVTSKISNGSITCPSS